MSRPITTLFMNISLDGKISTGDNDSRDTCMDYPVIKGIREGYQQYYDIEQTTDLHSLSTARVLTKSHNGKSINDVQEIQKTEVSFIVIDNKPHLTEEGVRNLLQKAKTLYLVTTNKDHPAFSLTDTENMEIIHYEQEIDFPDMFRQLKETYHIDAVTVQTGGTLNTTFIRENLIDKVSIVVVPALVGGKDTATLMDGESLHAQEDLKHIKTLKLESVKVLEHSYIHLRYDVDC